MLPTKKSEPENELKKYTILIYGRPGVGKTTLASQFDDPLFFMFEGGAKSLSIFKEPVVSWKKFVQKIDELKTEKHTFKTVVMDTFARAYDLCQEHVCKEMGIDHPTDAPYGKAWSAIKTEFRRQMSRLTAMDVGLVLICHTKDKEIEMLDGTMKTMTAPETSNQSLDFVNQEVDLVAYYFYTGKGNRRIRVAATEDIIAKNRIDGHFLGIQEFAAGTSAQSAYQAFINAFNNKITNQEVAHEVEARSSTSLKVNKRVSKFSFHKKTMGGR